MTFERRYLEALRADDPALALLRLSRDRRLAPELRRRLRLVDPDGVRLTALLVTKLRFERLLNGSLEAVRWFRKDAAGFARAFRRYHRDVPQAAFFPKAEARAFEVWRASARL